MSISGVQAYDAVAQVLHWTTYRRWRDEGRAHLKTTRIACRFTEVAVLDALLLRAGLAVRERYGDWTRAPFTTASPSFLSVCTSILPPGASARPEVGLPDVQPVPKSVCPTSSQCRSVARQSARSK